MKTAALYTLLISFTATIIWALVTGDMFAEGAIILAKPWGIVMMYDLYIGFLLFGMIIYYFENSWKTTALWLVPLCLLGNGVAIVYLLYRAKFIKKRLGAKHV